MVDKVSNALAEALDAFFQERRIYARYTSSGDPQIPTDAELVLLNAILQSTPVSEGDVLSTRSRLDSAQAYLLVTFAVRMAIHAARSQTLQPLRAGAFGLVLDENLVDWRDILVNLSIVEDCAVRLGTDLQSAFIDHIRLASERRRHTIVEGYLLRSPEMRGLEIMGVEAKGSGTSLTYRKIWV